MNASQISKTNPQDKGNKNTNPIAFTILLTKNNKTHNGLPVLPQYIAVIWYQGRCQPFNIWVTGLCQVVEY